MEEINNKISVIVPVYKVEDYLNECVQSIINQTYQNLQIILVDDGTPDRCGEMCDAWAKIDKRIEVIHKKNGGLSDARNVGLDAAKGNFIAFVDSDDWIEPQMYEVMMNALIKEKADFVACGIIDCYSGKEIKRSIPYNVGASETFLNLIYKDTTFPVATWNKLYRKKCWETLRFPVGKICEDAFTTYLLVDHASRIVQIPDLLYHYRIRKNSIMTSAFKHSRMDEEEAWRENYLYMKEHHPKIEKIAYDFYLQKVRILFHTIQPEQYCEFSKEHDYLYSILRNSLKYVLLKSSFNLKYKVRYLLDVLKMK